MGEIANKRDCSIAQVSLKWGMSRGTSVIPKVRTILLEMHFHPLTRCHQSAHAVYIDENLDSPNCELETEDYKTIAELGKKYTHRYNNPSKGWGLKLYEGLEDA